MVVIGGPTSGGGRIYAYSIFASGGSGGVSYGVGVSDNSGSNEVYAPRVSGVPAVADYSAIVLLDSILSTDETVVSSSPGFNPVVDAGCASAYNAEVVTKSFALSDPSDLKAYKTLMLTYIADQKVAGTGDPVSIRYAESLEPSVNFSATAYAEIPATGSNTDNARVSLVPRVIDTGVAFGVSTNYVAADGASGSNGQFKLYELFLNAVGLRKGRTVQ